MGEDGSVAVSKLSKEFKSIANINIFDQQTGQLRDTYSILQDMSKVWPTLTANQRQYLGELSAGKRQINVLESLLTNWEGVDKAMVAAADSAGSAERENAKYLDSIAGKTKALESAMQELSTTSVSDDLIKWFLDLEKSIVDFQTSIGGITPLILTLVTLFSSKLAPAILVVGKLIKNTLIADIQALKNVISGASLGFSGWFTIISAAVTVISAVVGAVNRASQAEKELRQQNIATAEATADSSKNLNELYAKYQALYKIQNRTKEQEEELTTTSKSLEDALGDRASVLKTLTDGTTDYNTELTKAMQTQANLDFGKATSGIEAFKKELDFSDYTIDIPIGQLPGEILGSGSVQDIISQSALDNLKEFSNYYEGMFAAGGGSDAQASINSLSQMQKYLSALEFTYGDLNTRLSQAKHDGDSLLVTQISQNELYVKLGTTIDGLKSKLSEYNSLLVTQAVSEKEMNGEYPATLQAYASFREGIISNIGATGDWATTLRTMIDELFPQFKGKLNDLIDPDYVSHVSEMTDALSASESQLSSLNSAYKTLSDAQDEYNKSGSLSIDTLSKLLALEPEYLKYLIDEKGNINLNKDAYEKLVKAKVDALKIDLLNKYTAEMDDLTHSSELQKKAVDKQVNSAESYIQGIKEKKKIDDTIKEQQAELTDEYNNTASAIDNLTWSLEDQADTTSKTETASEKIRSKLKHVGSEVESLSKKYDDLRNAREESEKSMMGNVDLAHRPIVPDGEDSYETVHSMTLNGEEEGTYFLVTPILPDGTKLDENENAIWDYVDKYFGGDMASSDIFLGLYNSIEEADSAAVKLHEDQAAAYNDEANAYLSLRSKTEEYLALQKELSEVIFDETNNKLDESQAAYKTLTDAIDEYNKTGVLSVDMLQSLLALSPEYIQLFFDQSSAAGTAEAAIYAQAEALKSSKIEELQAAAAADVYAYTQGNISKMSPMAKGAISNLSGTLLTAGSNYLSAAAKATVFKNTVLNSAKQLGANVTSSTVSGVNAIISAYQSAANKIANIGVSGINSKSGGGGSGKSKAQQQAEAIKDAYDSLLGSTMNMLKQKTNDRIDQLEDELDIEEELYKAEKQRIEDAVDGYKEIIDAKKKSLQLDKDEKDYQDEISDKNKEISEIQNRLTELEFDTSASAMAEKLKLQEELASKQKDLSKSQADREYDLTNQALDDDYEAYKKSQEEQINILDQNFEATKTDYKDRIQLLKDYLEEEGTIRTDALNMMNSKSAEFYNNLFAWNARFGDVTNATLQSIIDKAYEVVSISSGSRKGSKKKPTTPTPKTPPLPTKPSQKPPRAELYHDGLDAGFVGGGLKGNEEFIKALKGEVLVNPKQQEEYMRKILPNVLKNAYAGGATSVYAGMNMQYDKLIEINVSGSIDSNSISKIESTVNEAFTKLTGALSQRGVVRKANAFAT